MGLNARPYIHPRWREWASKAASEYQRNATIRIIRPNSSASLPNEPGKGFDIKGGSGGNSGKAASQLWPSVENLKAAPAWLGVISGNEQGSTNPATGNAEVAIQIEMDKFGETGDIGFGCQAYVVSCEDSRFVGKLLPIKRVASGSVTIERMIYAELPEGM